MVSFSQMQSSNTRIIEVLPAGLVAVFVGGTSGIGETTMKQLAKNTVEPRIYLVGRSREAATRIVAELHDLNPAGEYHFIQADVSLLHAVDWVCREIQARESVVNLLFLTPGVVSTSQGSDTIESLYYPMAVTYYSRIRFIVNLLPLLQKASHLRRVVTVFGAGKESLLDGDDFPLFPGRYHQAGPLQTTDHGSLSTMMTLALESLALEAPNISFVHSFPGFVKGSSTNSSPKTGGVIRAVFKVVGALPLFEAGERHLFLATSARFPARDGVHSRIPTAGVGLGKGVSVARGTDARDGSGVYSVNFDGESVAFKVQDTLQQLRDRDMVRRVWQHTIKEFTRVTGSAFV
ncbi:hypothetical protein QC763_302000 [Podospora pseudopauciseta]|uniref:Short-chain dehydrogenases/reductase n=1 Tax=Podospora pseudopauciseta TaxID=2093780 RepID=A0ABR0HFL5_9PEZI|nr:hypothetical protein QC763_302000 [Podospora pseudopauciseta]